MRDQIPWFRHDPKRTATGYRWLDWLTTPYWLLSSWWTERKLWRMMRIGDESWRQARTRFRLMWRLGEAAGKSYRGLIVDFLEDDE